MLWYLPVVPALGEAAAGGSEVHGHPQLHSEFQANLGYLVSNKDWKSTHGYGCRDGKTEAQRVAFAPSESQLEERAWVGSEKGEMKEKRPPGPFSSAWTPRSPTSPAGRGAGAWERRAGPSHVSCWHGSGQPHPLAVAALSLATWLKEAVLP